MIRALRLIAAICVIAAVTTADLAAQETGVITGTVVDQQTRQPISGVEVSIVGTTQSAITNDQGAFLLLRVAPGRRVLRATVLGFAGADIPVTVQAGQTARVDIALRVSALQLDEVVASAVTGRVERKRELGTNTATISSRDLERAPITKMADVLVGRAAGVQLQGVAGSIGTSQRIRIRGANSISLSNEPLIFVDGVMFSNTRGGFAVGGQDYSRLNDINPEDIANMEILKGPAASALYGTAAANGVILITTKRGQAGNTRWHAYTEFGTSEDITDYPLNYLPYMINADTANLFTARGNLNEGSSTSRPFRFCPNYGAGTTPNLANGSCRQDEILTLTPLTAPGLSPFVKGNRTKVGLSVSGGSDVVTYYVSGDIDQEQGVISFNEQDRVNLRTNLGARIRDNLGLNINAAYTRSTLALNGNDNNIFSPLINGLLATPFVPTAEQRAGSPAGSRFGTGYGFFIDDLENYKSDQVVDRFIVGASSNYQPISWLTVNGNVGLDFFSREDGTTIQPGRLPISFSYVNGWRQSQRSNNYIWTTNAAAVGTFRPMEDLGSTTTLGGSFSREQFEMTYCYGVGIVEGTSSCGATSSLFSVDEGYTEVRTIGAYLQQQLNWRERLIVSGSVRGDDNSAFGQEFGFIYYPGVSVSWVASEEPFFPETDILSNLRLRAAYGKSGQRPNVRDAVTLLEPVAVASGNTDLSAVRLRSIGNVDLKPERTTEFEFGFDAGVLSDRVAIEFTRFTKKSVDALVNRPLPASYGLTGDAATTGSIFDNLGSVKNWGMELALNARVLNIPQASANLRLSATTLDNEIIDLGEDIQPIVFNRGNQQHKQGFPTGGFFGRRYEIVNPGQQRVLTPADVIMVDDTSVFLGPQLPTSTQTLSGDITLFRNLVTISGLLERRAGHKQLNYTEFFRCQTGYNNGTQGAARGQCQAVGDPNAPLEEQARFLAARFGATTSTGTLSATQAGYAEDADFIKLRELSLTLGVPQSLSNRFSVLQGASLTLSGRNLKTWTDYTGLDPEINETGGGANFTQGEFNTQPPLRYYTVRFNFTF
ncbi:MAG TPA: SusC/RagA family TonB-linked outer membrane protein [Longimicrobiales bacterium]|nr:SusC/RagA family TonB-linked outer membrane protein [Longimicrobiales bacterium]